MRLEGRETGVSRNACCSRLLAPPTSHNLKGNLMPAHCNERAQQDSALRRLTSTTMAAIQRRETAAAAPTTAHVHGGSALTAASSSRGMGNAPLRFPAKQTAVRAFSISSSKRLTHCLVFCSQNQVSVNSTAVVPGDDGGKHHVCRSDIT